MQVRCPKCGKQTVYSPENKYRPFCSERCRTLDLGDWASENYKVPTNENDLDKDTVKDVEEDSGDLPN